MKDVAPIEAALVAAARVAAPMLAADGSRLVVLRLVPDGPRGSVAASVHGAAEPLHYRVEIGGQA